VIRFGLRQIERGFLAASIQRVRVATSLRGRADLSRFVNKCNYVEMKLFVVQGTPNWEKVQELLGVWCGIREMMSSDNIHICFTESLSYPYFFSVSGICYIS
jgi:hypothetical protein